MAVMKIGSKVIGSGYPGLMVAEGRANQGDVGLAIKMCKLAAEAGADGIEFQFFLADDMYVRANHGHTVTYVVS